MELLIIFFIIALLCVIFACFSSHYTRSLGYLIIGIVDSIMCVFVYKFAELNIVNKNFSNLIIYLLIYLLVLIIYNYLYYLICKNKTYDFLGKVINFSYLKNSLIEPLKTNNFIQNDTRIIGKVIAYSNSQLKYNGRFLTASSIATAGATLISGSAGSGKTFFIESLIKQNILNKKNVVFSEFKGDTKVINRISAYAHDNDYDVYLLKNGHSNFNYDPLKNLNNAGRISAILNMRKWSLDGADNHYKVTTQVLLQNLVGNFRFNSNDKNNYTFQFYNYVQNYRYDSSERDAYSTVCNLLKLLLTSSLKPMFSGKNEKNFDFSEYASGNNKRNFIIITSFVSSNKDLATSFTSLFIKDLLDVYTNYSVAENIYLYIDEFATLENPFIVKDLLEKGRSLRIATTLGLQDINQIVIQTNEAYLDSILGTINNFCIFNGATRRTAEKLAGVQLADIEYIIMNLRKPINGKPPTALYVSKYPSLNKRTNTEVFRFIPYIVKNSNKLSDDNELYLDQQNNKEVANKNSGLYSYKKDEGRENQNYQEKIDYKEDSNDSNINNLFDDLI